MGEIKVHRVFWWRNLKKGNHLEDPGLNGVVILEWISKKWTVSI
jgi:hypothetical protein